MASLVTKGGSVARSMTSNVGPIGSIRRITSKAVNKKEGDISSVFASLSGSVSTPLPNRFADIKRDLVRDKANEISASWNRLLKLLAVRNEDVAQKGPSMVPQINFNDLQNPAEDTLRDIRNKGVAVIRGVIPETEARNYKTEVEEYVRANPGTKAFPSHDPQVFELYWSSPQIRARAHPNMIRAQRFLMSLWHSNEYHAVISKLHPLAYADRVRIRQPGDSSFALGPHVDGGSVERWEPNGYGLGGVYDKIWNGRWEDYDPFEAASRVDVVSDLYSGAGACSMFRMFQGWLSLSHTGPNQGTLKVNPLLQLSTAYFLLRPFFAPIQNPSSFSDQSDFLDAKNWTIVSESEMTAELQGATPGNSQELLEELHPHLDLAKTMVHVPEINPGDVVVWHCDTIHAVDKLHEGDSDSSVMYIPVCPVTQPNAEYLARQRATFLSGHPGPDFPGGKGESEHAGRPSERYLRDNSRLEGLQAMGFEKLSGTGSEGMSGAAKAVTKANEILGFH